MRIKIFIFLILGLAVLGVCFAQSNSSDTDSSMGSVTSNNDTNENASGTNSISQ